MLQQLPTIPVPLMRQFVVFAQIAKWACNDQISRIIRTTTIKWYHMINMIIFANFTSAPITLSLLSFIQPVNIFGGNYTANPFKFGSSFVRCYPVFQFMRDIVLVSSSPFFFRMFSLIFFGFFILFNSMFVMVTSAVCTGIFSIIGIPTFFKFGISLFPSVKIFCTIFLMLRSIFLNTHLAFIVQTIRFRFVTREVFCCRKQERITAAAKFEKSGLVKHSILVNAISHEVCSQSGTRAAFLGATLGYYPIITQFDAIYHVRAVA